MKDARDCQHCQQIWQMMKQHDDQQLAQLTQHLKEHLDREMVARDATGAAA